MNKFICIDIGGTAIKYSIIDDNERISDKAEIDTEAYMGGKAILDKVRNIVKSCIDKYKISGICISTCGMVNADNGEIFYASSAVPDYAGIAFKTVLENEFNIPCEVENDVNCAGLAEYISGAAKGSKSALVLTVGTGIGGAFILNGELIRGNIGAACEIGYMKFDESDFQTLGATSTLVKKVAEIKHEDITLWNGRRVFDEAGKGDEICISAIDEMSDVLGKGIANICYVLNPEVVVLGGGIMAQEKILKKRIEASIHKYLVPVIAENTEIRFALHKNDAGMLGAFYNFKKKVC